MLAAYPSPHSRLLALLPPILIPPPHNHNPTHPPPPAPSSRPTPRAAAARADRPALSRHRAAPAYPDHDAVASIAVAAAPLAALDPGAVLHRPVPRAAHARRALYLQQRPL